MWALPTAAGFHGQQKFSVFSQERSFFWGFRLYIRTFVGEKNERRLFLSWAMCSGEVSPGKKVEFLVFSPSNYHILIHDGFLLY